MRPITFILDICLMTLSFISCGNDETEPPLIPNQLRFLFSEVSMETTIGESATRTTETMRFENENLSEFVLTSGFLDVNYVYTTTATTDADGKSVFHCTRNNNFIYRLVCEPAKNGVVQRAKRIAHEDTDRDYTFGYTLIDGYRYLAEIVEAIDGKVFYSLSFDYSNFASGIIVLKQALSGVETSRATLRVSHNNPAGVPDKLLFRFHPFDKFTECVYAGSLGSFDYVIVELATDGETLETEVRYDEEGRIAETTVTSDKKGVKERFCRYGYR